MADLKVTQLSSLGAMPATNDLLMVVDVSDTSMSAAGTNKQVTANYFGLTSGAVIYSQDGKALTLPASGTAATRQAANTFTDAQTIAPSGTSVTLLTLTPATNNGGTTPFILSTFDNGSNTGPSMFIGRNSNASTPAAGSFRLSQHSGTSRYFWLDNSGLFRVHTGGPTNATDTAGTVVGDQTSALAAKDVLPSVATIAEIWDRIRTGAEAVRRFTYKSGAYNNQEFEGVVIDYAPEYGKDKDSEDPEYPAGKALNEVTIIGDLLRAVADLAARVAALESA